MPLLLDDPWELLRSELLLARLGGLNEADEEGPSLRLRLSRLTAFLDERRWEEDDDVPWGGLLDEETERNDGGGGMELGCMES